MRDDTRWLRRAAVLCTGLFLLLLGTAVPASAHAALRGTDPDDGSLLRTAPRRVSLTFTEPVSLLTDSLRVYDPGNHRLRTGEAGHAPGRSDTVRVRLPHRLRTGTYTVAWRVVSADSHPVSGALTFSVGERSATTVGVAPDRTENPATTSLYGIARYLSYLAAALLLGTAAFVAYCRPPTRTHLRRPALAAWWALLASTVVLFLLRAPYEEGTSPAQSLGLSALGRTATTRPGELLLARLALLLLPVVCAPVLRRWHRRVPRGAVHAAAAVLATALALTWAASEHASAGLQVPLAITSTVLHLLAMAAWLGGLAALLATLRHASEGLAGTVSRFSRLAFASVTVLVVTGIYQSWRGLGSWQALTGTTYGRILLAKLAAVTLLLAAASRSRHWTARLASPAPAPLPDRVPAPAGGPPLPPADAAGPTAQAGPLPDRGLTSPATAPLRGRVAAPAGGPPLPPADAAGSPGPAEPLPDRLRRSVLAEMAVGVVVLVLTTQLTSTLPGRAAADAARAGTAAAGIPTASVTTIPFDVGRPGGHGKVQITLDPGRVGVNSVQAVVYGPDGGLASIPELRVTLTLPARRLGPLDTGVTDRGGYWAADSFNLPMPGTWTMKATVRVSDVDQVTVSRTVRVVR
ncbi:copper resistance CopC/CopD family protein [Streptomyces bungoensis]|uniref:copper resistance CopC/CopD family protein n=1 Tax=Streptomyces bungoensis TaxID=285568 RepID=UPI0034438465